MSQVVKTPKALYRYLLRKIAPLPSSAHQYYKHRIRQASNTCRESYLIPY